ncbi:MAG TPA: LapA family protein [Firmicutes bacterium]|nr:LapA family protein [Bacillota bacterium]
MARVGILMIIVLVVAAFVGQNTMPVEVAFLVWKGNVPAWSLVVLPFGLGILIVVLAFGIPGSLKANRMKSRIQQLEEKVRMLESMREGKDDDARGSSCQDTRGS